LEIAEGRARQELHDYHVPPNKVACALHDRMPVILAPDTWSRWLGEQSATADELKALLVPCPDEVLKIWPVDRAKIGNVRNKGHDVAERATPSA
jgi:putative SOS response-associated peptidase YedK